MSDLYRKATQAELIAWTRGGCSDDSVQVIDAVRVERCPHGLVDPHFTEFDPLKDRSLDGHECAGATTNSVSVDSSLVVDNE